MATHALRAPAPLPRLSRAQRLRARLHGWNLDSELASGVDPVARPDLAARAAWLTSYRRRQQLAAGLEKVVREAERPNAGLTASPPLHRPSVRSSRTELLELASALRGPQLVAPRGVAMIRRLLVEDVSALHTGDADRLHAEIAEIRAALTGAVR
jgi:hypothetical protein